jgi:hypothetical protein
VTALAERLSVSSLARSRDFSWEKTAVETRAVLESAAGAREL